MCILINKQEHYYYYYNWQCIFIVIELNKVYPSKCKYCKYGLKLFISSNNLTNAVLIKFIWHQRNKHKTKHCEINTSSVTYLTIIVAMSTHNIWWTKTQRSEEGGCGGSLTADRIDTQKRASERGRKRTRKIGQMAAPRLKAVLCTPLSLPLFSSLNAYFHHFA